MTCTAPARHRCRSWRSDPLPPRFAVGRRVEASQGPSRLAWCSGPSQPEVGTKLGVWNHSPVFYVAFAGGNPFRFGVRQGLILHGRFARINSGARLAVISRNSSIRLRLDVEPDDVAIGVEHAGLYIPHGLDEKRHGSFSHDVPPQGIFARWRALTCSGRRFHTFSHGQLRQAPGMAPLCRSPAHRTKITGRWGKRQARPARPGMPHYARLIGSARPSGLLRRTRPPAGRLQ